MMKISYRFIFEDGSKKLFSVNLDPDKLEVIPPDDQAEPEWAMVGNCRCQGCQVDDGKAYCPIAVNISDIVGFFKSHISHASVEVRVATEDRVYGKKTTIQQALSSLLGIYMAASGCPSMEKLKPMVRFHLPFATIEETVFRSVGAYLMGQYFLKRKGKRADLELGQLADFYRQIQAVNSGISDRIRKAVAKDAVNNAVVCLDIFAKELPYAIEGGLADLEELFSVFWK